MHKTIAIGRSLIFCCRPGWTGYESSVPWGGTANNVMGRFVLRTSGGSVNAAQSSDGRAAPALLKRKQNEASP